METYYIVAEHPVTGHIVRFWCGRRYMSKTPHGITEYLTLGRARQALTKLKQGSWQAWAEDLGLELVITDDTEMAILTRAGAW